MNEPTQYFKIALLTLGVLVLMLTSIFTNIARAGEMRHAPVVEAQGSDSVRKQVGWYTYEKQDNAVVLYCMPDGDATVACVVFVSTDKGNAIVLVDGVVATEQRT